MVERAVQDDTTASVLDAIEELCPTWRREEVYVEHYLSGGYRNQNYRLNYGDDHFVLRMAEHTSDLGFEREHRRLKSLEEIFPAQLTNLSITIAPVIAAAPQHGLLLTRWCSEPLLADTAGVTAESMGSYLALLHRSLARVPARHHVSAENSGPEQPDEFTLQSHIHQDLKTAGASEQSAQHLLRNLAQPTYPAVACHLDLNPWNLLLHKNSWVTLDWETLCLADPMFDLAALCDGYLRSQELDEEQLDFGNSALSAYNSTRASCWEPNCQRYTQSDLQAARTLFQWREYAWAAAQLAQGNLREEITEQREHYAALLTKQGFDVLPG